MQGNLLFIVNVKKENEGIYQCIGETEEEYTWSERKVQFAAQSKLIVIGMFTYY